MRHVRPRTHPPHKILFQILDNADLRFFNSSDNNSSIDDRYSDNVNSVLISLKYEKLNHPSLTGVLILGEQFHDILV